MIFHLTKKSDRLEDLDNKIAELESQPDIHNPACAFVTFETREAKLRALAAYPRSTLFYWCCQGRCCECCCCLEKRMHTKLPRLETEERMEEGRKKVSDTDAKGQKYLKEVMLNEDQDDHMYRVWMSSHTPAPENILWQNLAVGRASRCLRILTSSLITIVLLLATIGGSILLKNQTLKMSREYPSVDCATLEKVVAFNKRSDVSSELGIMLEDAILDEMQIERINSTHFEQKNSKLSLLGCYCASHINTIYTTEFVPADYNISLPIPEGYVENGLFGLDYRKTWCIKWAVDSAQKQGLGVASVLIIVIVNAMLKAVMKRLVNMEAPISQSGFSKSLMSKLTIFSFLNTAMVTIIVNANLNDFSTGEIDLTLNGMLFNGDYSDFSKAWHVYIGTALLLSKFTTNTICMFVLKELLQ